MEKRQPDGTFTEEKISREEIERRTAPMREPVAVTHDHAPMSFRPNRAERRRRARDARRMRAGR